MKPNKLVTYKSHATGNIHTLEISSASNKSIREMFYPNRVLKIETLGKGSKQMESLK